MNAADDNKKDLSLLDRAAVGTAVVSGVFVAIVCGVLVWNYYKIDTANPQDNDEFRALKAALKSDPSNDAIAEKIRRLDAELRREYFGRQEFAVRGGFFLVAGMVVFLTATGYAIDRRKKPPMPARPADARPGEAREATVARLSVGLVAVAIAISAMVLVMVGPDVRFPTGHGQPDTQQGGEQAAVFPSAEEIGKNWPRFRGPGGAGVSAYDNVPSAWDGATGRGILWKTRVPLPGKNSPVVWGKRVFLTGATADVRRVYCFDADSGRMIWSRDVTAAGPGSTRPTVAQATGYAASTAVVDGQRVYAIFANGDLTCLKLDGARVWTRRLGVPDNMYGHAASLAMWRNLLIVQFDQASVDDRRSRIMALDALTGRTVWTRHRQVPNSWSSPIIIDDDARRQIITCADPWVISYDPADGSELWRVRCLSGDVAPSPIYAGGLVFAVNANAVLAAIRPDGTGDVTQTHVAWTADEGLPDICSPVSDGPRVFLLETYGTLTCYDARTGRQIWTEDLEASFQASPSLAGGRLYLLSDAGVMTIAETSGRYEPVATAKLGEKAYASPAFMDGRIYIRGSENLFCIGQKKQ